eukprot:gene4977-8571_t
MCSLATKDSDFIEVCPFGYGSAKKSGIEIESVLNSNITLDKKIFGNNRIQFLEIGGADYALKYSSWKKKSMVCLDRGGLINEVKKKMKQDGIESSISNFYLISSDELKPISSTEIRKQMETGEFDETMIHKDVIMYIKETGKNLYL